MIMHPVMGKMVRKAMTGPFLWYFVAMYDPPTVDISCTMPNGALNRMA